MRANATTSNDGVGDGIGVVVPVRDQVRETILALFVIDTLVRIDTAMHQFRYNLNHNLIYLFF